MLWKSAGCRYDLGGKTKTELTFLGTGTSHGVPMIGCKCPICTSTDLHNKRMRASVLVECGGRNIIIDTTPEFRLQCLANNVERVDFVLYTHAHADHIFGLDDIRRFNEMQDREIRCYGDSHTMRTIRRAFDYIFVPTQIGGGKPRIKLIEVSGPFEADGIEIVPVPVRHGRMSIFGYRIGGLAYITDCSEMPESSKNLLRGLDVLVLGALRKQHHSTHLTLEQAVELSRELAPKRTFFVHMSHKLDHEETNRELPPEIRLAYDGLRVYIQE